MLHTSNNSHSLYTLHIRIKIVSLPNFCLHKPLPDYVYTIPGIFSLELSSRLFMHRMHEYLSALHTQGVRACEAKEWDLGGKEIGIRTRKKATGYTCGKVEMTRVNWAINFPKRKKILKRKRGREPELNIPLRPRHFFPSLLFVFWVDTSYSFSSDTCEKIFETETKN